MREAIFILIVLAALLGLTAYRYRRQIRMALELWRTVKSIRQTNQQGSAGSINEKPAAKGNLVNCSKCGTWVPEGNAIRLGQTAFYCSAKCMESKAKV